jgi:hypothetical protein
MEATELPTHNTQMHSPYLDARSYRISLLHVFRRDLGTVEMSCRCTFRTRVCSYRDQESNDLKLVVGPDQ